jgi:hypothetical protein
VEKVDGGHSTRPAGLMAWPSGHHMAPNQLIQVGGAPTRAYKYSPPPTVEMRRHTTFGDSTCKALILSVVARCSFVKRVARLPRSLSVEALSESFMVRQGFSTLVCSSAKALPESSGFQQRVSAQVPWVK